MNDDFEPNLSTSTEDYQCIITFNEQTYVDKTMWTIRSHFIAMAILFLLAFKLYYYPHRRKILASYGIPRQQMIVERLAPLFLLTESISHGCYGLYHWTVTNAQSQSLWESIAQMFAILATVIFFLFTIMVVMSSNLQLSQCVQLIWRLGISGLWLAIIYAYMVEGSVFLGISLHMYILVAICLLLLLAYGIRICHVNTTNGETIYHFCFKSIALWMNIIATAYAYNVYRKCGSYNGYLECFIRCPLPGGLNHNSFYNLAKALALIVWGLAEDYHPSISLYQLSLGLREEEATVLSDASDIFDFDTNMDKEDEDEEENEGMEVMEDDADHQGQNDVESNGDLEASRDTTPPPDIESQWSEENTGTIDNNIGSVDDSLSDDQAAVEELESSPIESTPIKEETICTNESAEERPVETNESNSLPSDSKENGNCRDEEEGK